jgi:lysophospholipase L1-like esterase
MEEDAGTVLSNQPVIPNRLLIVGDSLAMGAAEVSNSDVTSFITPAYPELLRALFPKLDIIEISGVRYDTNVARKQLPDLLQAHRPAVVLLAVGGSDVDPDWRKAILSNGKRSRSRVSLEDYEKNLRAIIALIKAAKATPILIEGTSSCVAMRGVYLGRLSGIDVSAMIAAGGGQKVNDDRVEHYRETVRRIAAELEVDIAPCPPALATEDPHSIYTADGVHLLPAAHRHLSAAYAAVIRRAFDLRDDSAVA